VPATGSDDVEMVEVPAGEFIMGVSEETALDSYRHWYAEHPPTSKIPVPEYSDQTPRLTVYLDTFSIDRIEVTNARYRRCVEAGFCVPHNYAAIEGYTSDPAYDDYPALVPWADARAYCQWVGKRLPTEAEWEKAARGTDGRPYPWGEEEQPDWANLGYEPAPVGSHPRDLSPYGALDMGGNALEWTLDRFLPYPGNPRWDPDVSGYVARGGFGEWVSPTTFRRVRHGLEGFRCVEGSEPPALAEAVVEVSTYPTPAPTPQVDLSEMVYVPAGEFIMGNDDVGDDPVRQVERPAHVVYLDGFYIDRYSVTAAELAAFLNAVGGHKWRCGSDCIYTQAGPEEKPVGLEIQIVDGHYVPGEGYEDMPVTIATWEGARDYCEWVGKRLPTEAEWEKAARGTDGRLYPWGDEWDPTRPASGLRAIGDDAAPVGTHPGDVSPYGVYDMLGNVPEWVADWYDPEYYHRSPYANPQGPKEGVIHVARGHFGPIAKLGITDRGPGGGITGFRCAYTP
jgi:formylglycine-generating enzyme required for sulfatase activity